MGTEEYAAFRWRHRLGAVGRWQRGLCLALAAVLIGSPGVALLSAEQVRAQDDPLALADGPGEAAEFRSGFSALDEVVRRLKDVLGLITFYTVGDTEARAWTLRYGETALAAEEGIHSDIARGFIRCEVIRWHDLVECGSHSEAARRGLQRLEGKSYVVEDGDVLNVRFNV